ncbi:hypothetical protein [Sphaerisporangium sp. NPDC051011]|uniref:hypothetical protein n=1 Tax=Sphaerisporangium sp. NPDC051011 TaxID=3155792 RepID=UPI0034022F3C
MSVLLCLNELSCASEADHRRVDADMASFVDLLRLCKQWRENVALVTAVQLKELELAPGYPISVWAADGRNRDRWRFIRGLQNRAPFRTVISGDVVDQVEYQVDGTRAHGVGTAHLVDGLAVSLPVEHRWGHAWLGADRSLLTEDTDGELTLRKDQVHVRHASTPEHLREHEEWAKSSGYNAVRTGAALWESRFDFFPHLRFLPRVARDLQGLRYDWVVPVRERLLEMESAVAKWDITNSPTPSWRSKESGEGETRRRLCRFTDLDGIEREFVEHLRFTPGPGRLHFRLVREERAAVIAYIGTKILG